MPCTVIIFLSVIITIASIVALICCFVERNPRSFIIFIMLLFMGLALAGWYKTADFPLYEVIKDVKITQAEGYQVIMDAKGRVYNITKITGRTLDLSKTTVEIEHSNLMSDLIYWDSLCAQILVVNGERIPLSPERCRIPYGKD